MRSILTLLSLAALPLKGAPTEVDYFIHLNGYEGFKLSPYRDGKDTCVGVGHNLTAHKRTPKASYTQEEIMGFFHSDLAIALRAARKGITNFDQLPDEVQLVMVSLIWTVGPTGFLKFKNLRRALSWRAYDSAAAEIRDSLWFHQVQTSRANETFRVLRSQP